MFLGGVNYGSFKGSYLGSTNMTWYQAKEQCESLEAGSFLPIIAGPKDLYRLKYKNYE